MFIKQLSIYESFPEEKLIRSVLFKKGVNFIVDESEGGKGNNIGKTTTLKVADICLGAQDRKYIYTDFETSIENLKLKSYINESKVYATLTLVDSLDNTKEQHIIRVDLYERGFRYIDGEQFNYQDFNRQLNKIIFGNYLEKPTFRQLIGMFVRVDQKSDNDKFMKYVRFASYEDYENIYSYLFRLKDQAISKEVLDLKDNIKTISNDIKKLLSLNSIKNINIVKQRLVGINKDVDSAKRGLSVLVDASEMKKNEDAIAEVRTKYALIADQLDRYQFKVDRISSIIEDAKNDTKQKIDVGVLKNLYAETQSNFAEITKTFNDLVKFNEQLVGNKIKFFEKQLKESRDKLEQLLTERNNLLESYKDVIVLIKNSDVGQYVSLQTKLEISSQEKGQFEKILELHNTLSETQAQYESQLENLSSEPTDNPQDNINKFNEFFTPYSKRIIQDPYLLFLTGETFPIGIDNVNTGISTGTKKSVISSFDLAYQSFAKTKGIESPRFIIHDVIETMDGVALDNTIQLANSIGCQYIVAVLKDKIKDNKLITEEDIRLKLSASSKFFRM